MERAGVLQGGSRLSELLSDGGVEGYSRAINPRDFNFPQDHGPHTDYRNEWWYVTGNLDGPDDERFGFELTFFRFSLTPDNNNDIRSAWQTNQVYIGHFAITDVGGEDFHVAQRYSRGSVGLAGAEADPFRVWLDDWSIGVLPDGDELQWRLKAKDDEVGLDLNLTALKPPILNGDRGLSQKAGKAGNASYYYSLTRLQSDGTLQLGDRSYAVSGLSWLDREWGSSALSSNQRGWDWFALQLSDGSELMFYRLRLNDGSIDGHSAGTWVDAVGNATHLSKDDVSILETKYWNSERGGTYPSAWDIEVSSLDLTLTVKPVLDDQELVTNVRYWEGAVDVHGTTAGQVLSGRGYVELTGYADN